MNFTYTFTVDKDVDKGKVRSSNQDEVILLPECFFFAVSDGMGGLINGGETSQLIKEKLGEIMKTACMELSEDSSEDSAEEILKTKICLLNEQIYTEGIQYGPDRFGATLSGVWLVGDCVIFANIGDSRGYIFKDNVLRQITKDHNLAAHLVEIGELTKEEARNHPANSRLLRFIGMKPPAKPELFKEKITPGCAILLCSDGLHGMVDDEEIAKILSEKNGGIAEKLIETANNNGGKDNISAIYIAIDENSNGEGK